MCFAIPLVLPLVSTFLDPVDALTPANAGEAGDAGFNSCVRKIHWRRKWQPTPVFLPGKPMVRGAWQATVHGVAMSRT